jgi:hypothetical protein
MNGVKFLRNSVDPDKLAKAKLKHKEAERIWAEADKKHNQLSDALVKIRDNAAQTAYKKSYDRLLDEQKITIDKLSEVKEAERLALMQMNGEWSKAEDAVNEAWQVVLDLTN